MNRALASGTAILAVASNDSPGERDSGEAWFCRFSYFFVQPKPYNHLQTYILAEITYMQQGILVRDGERVFIDRKGFKE
jgi:hypothetical protein